MTGGLIGQQEILLPPHSCGNSKPQESHSLLLLYSSSFLDRVVKIGTFKSPCFALHFHTKNLTSEAIVQGGFLIGLGCSNFTNLCGIMMHYSQVRPESIRTRLKDLQREMPCEFKIRFSSERQKARGEINTEYKWG